MKKLARRLGVRHSDVIRFAIKSTLARLAPLIDSEARGRDLLPVFLQSGAELALYLDLDAARLEAVINEDTDASHRVDHGDIQLLAYSGLQRPYARLRLSMLKAHIPSAEPISIDEDEASEDQSLRRYFFQKYVFEQRAGARPAEELES